VSEQTIDAPPTNTAPRSDPPGPRRRPALLEGAGRHPWAIVGVALVVFSAALVLWARTRPGYDPYGWLNWGYQALHLSLDLGGAPSWKPLPFLFDIPYALFGHYALWMWMTTAVAVSLSGSIFAGRIAYRLVGSDGDRRPAIIAAIFAGFAVLGTEGYFHLILSVQSDPMIVSLCLAAIDMHLSGRHRWSFTFWVLASLGRPEVWPFLAAYSFWAWRSVPAMRAMIAGGLLLVPLLWFGVPTITNGRPLISGQLAERSPRMLHENKIVGTFHRFTELTYLPIQLAAIGATIWAWIRRERAVLAMAGFVVAWLVIEIAFVLHGWPGVPRYMFEPAGVLAVMAAVAVGWLLRDARRLGPRIPRWAGLPVVAVIVIALVPGAIARLRAEHKDLRHERARTTVINQLDAAVSHVGGAAAITNCGKPVTDVEYVSIIANYTKLNDGDVGHRPKFEVTLTHPIVVFTHLTNGWAMTPYHTPAAKQAVCSKLHKLWIYTAHHPGGVLVPNLR
jgi:hypothetical protein